MNDRTSGGGAGSTADRAGGTAGANPRGAVVFLTGLSGAGKSTIAKALAARIRSGGREATVIDGDVLRQHLSADLGFDAASREANVRRAAELAARFAADGKVVITALIAPFERSRREARRIVEPVAPFLLVYVSTPLEVAEARDPKGLYRRARAGEIPDFTGIDSPFEPPSYADLVIETTTTPVEEAVRLITTALDASANASA